MNACDTILHPVANGPGPSFEHAMLRVDTDSFHSRIDHQCTNVHGVELLDATHPKQIETNRHLISVGIRGESMWLKAEEVLEIAAALKHMANAQIARVFNERHRVFLINHPGANDAAVQLQPGVKVRTLHGELDDDENGQERHTAPGTWGALDHFDAGSGHWAVYFPNGAAILLEPTELNDRRQYELAPAQGGAA